ncbi:MAG: M28 family peptidase [Candidatus Eisenbacteria bacterium]
MNPSRVQKIVVAPLLVLLLGGCGGPEFDQESAFGFLEAQCAFGPRPPGSGAHGRTAEWLVETLSHSADEVAVQRFTVPTDTGQVRLTNVIASFRPDERERVLLGAHWDTRAVAERDPEPGNRGLPIPGANDGASGVAVLLELARLMGERAPRVGVDIVLFDGEDGGNDGGLVDWCLGSTYYASTMGAYCPRYAVIVDMVGDADLSIPREPNSVDACSDIVDIVWRAAERVGSDAFLPGLGKAMYDDHVPLIRAGVPTALVIDASYAYWHTLDDTPARCSPASLGQVGRVLVELVY